MYKEYFGLEELPFSIAPDPRYLYMSEQHREALAHLVFGLNSDGGFVLLTGEVGTGKTTVCRCLLEQLPENSDIAFILNPKLTVEELLGSICDEFGIHYPEGNTSVKVFVDRINAYLLDAHARGRKAVVILEEAQNLSSGVLEQLRLLTNLETNERKLLQIIMLGQPELRDMLSRPELRQLAQRITARYHLRSLSKKDVQAYISCRLGISGVHSPLFSSSAIGKVYRRSRGIPRVINVICDRALLGAYVRGQKKVDGATLSKAAREVFGERVVSKRILKWALTGSVLVISVTALAATFYNHKIQLFPEKKTAASEKPHSAPAAEKIDKLEWPAGQPVQLSKEMACQALFKEWNIPYEPQDQEDTRRQAKAWGFDYMEAKGNLGSLIQMDRPGMFKVSDSQGREFYATLTSVKGRVATVIIGAEVKRIDIDELTRSWPGAYSLLWRSAPRFHKIKPGDKGSDVQWLENQMSLIRGDTTQARKNRVFDDALGKQVEAFQLSEGLKNDGVVGRQTLIHMYAALEKMEPTLARKDK